MMSNEVAWTPPGFYPEYVNFRKEKEGIVEITLRGCPTTVQGVRICGRDCHPGGQFCNNYCALHPGGISVPDKANPMTYHKEGPTVSIEVPIDKFKELVLGLMNF